MRKLIYGINLTIDGCCDHTKGKGTEDIHYYFARLMREAGTLVYGRITYELMVPFWPDVAKDRSGGSQSINEFAEAFDAVPEIVVFSRTLLPPAGGKTRVVKGDLHHEIAALKQQPGKSILLGGVSLPSQLLELGLIDEFHVVVQPIIAGEGRRLFDHVRLPEGLELKLAESVALGSGNVALKYVSR